MKGYWIARVSVTNPERYPDYLKASVAAFGKYGARFLVRGGEFTALEGEARERNVVIEFPDYESALACYHSPEYQAAARIRQESSVGELMIVKGVE
ncbi:MAG: DUF1330 domain-containing protein [Hyphomicrobiales bacterium]|nr:DUF1330 domain-containing protein [Hyphomicrobiales bacterium]